jgi:hypothetical protein
MTVLYWLSGDRAMNRVCPSGRKTVLPQCLYIQPLSRMNNSLTFCMIAHSLCVYLQSTYKQSFVQKGF